MKLLIGTNDPTNGYNIYDPSAGTLTFIAHAALPGSWATDVIASVPAVLTNDELIFSSLDSGASDYILAWISRNGTTITEVDSDDTLTWTADYIAVPPDSDGYAATTSPASPSGFFLWWSLAGAALTQLTTPDSLATTPAFSPTWTPGATHLAVSFDPGPVSPQFYDVTYLYARSGSTLTQVDYIGELRFEDDGGTGPDLYPGNHVAFDPTGELLVAVEPAPGSSRYPIAVYSLSGDTLTFEDDPDAPTTGSRRPLWSPDGSLLVVHADDSPYYTIYSRSGTTLTKLTSPISLPAGTDSVQFAWSPDGDYLAADVDVTGGDDIVRWWSVSGSTFTQQTDLTKNGNEGGIFWHRPDAVTPTGWVVGSVGF